MPHADKLDRLLIEAGERWRAGQSAPRIEEIWRPEPRNRVPSSTSVLVAAGLAVALAVAVAVGGVGRLGRSNVAVGPPGGSAPASEAASASVTAASPLPSGDLGIPSEIGGEPVLIGDAADEALRRSTDATPILIGGWLRTALVYFCPAQRSPNLFNSCGALQLWEQPFGGPSGLVLHGDTGLAPISPIPGGLERPVVFRVHTHDPECAPPLTDCEHLPVVDQLVWAGQLVPIASATSTAPPNGLTEAQAEAIAVSTSAARASGTVVAQSARSGFYAVVGPPGSDDVAGDRWVWAVVVSGSFGAPDCRDGEACPVVGVTSLVVLDYLTGEVLIQETPAP
jgi:hypothetical protein